MLVVTGGGVGVGIEVGVEVGKGHPALCMPSCIIHRMISCDGTIREAADEAADDANDDDDEDEDDN